MNFLFNLATANSGADSGSNSGGGLGSPWVIIVVIAVFVLMFVLTSIPQKKRQKEMRKMLSELRPGDQVKTIGGMIGTITAVNDMTGIMTINVGTDDAPTYINIDRVAIYTVAKNSANVEPAPIVDEQLPEANDENKEDK